MNIKLPLTLFGLVAGSVSAADHVSIHHLSFEEYGDKIKAGDNILSLEKNIGLDWTITAELGYDTVSGASPAWVPTTPSSGVIAGKRTQEAQDKTSEVIRAGYDPYRGNYEMRPVELEDTRYSAATNVTFRDKDRDEWTLGVNYSQEDDYKSMGANAKALLYTDSSKNRSFSLGGSVLSDQTLAFQEYQNGGNEQQWKDIFTSSMEVGMSQVFTPNLYATFTAYGGYKSGYLSNHYLTVLREVDIDDDGKISDDEVFLAQDSRPDTRISGGINVQTFYSVTDRVVVRPRYKFFTDDWGVMSHQLGGKMSIKITDWLMLAPGYSWYSQQGANFFIDPKSSDPTFASKGYATTDIRLGDFNANAYELGVSLKLSSKWRMNALAAYYEQSNGYASRWWAVGVTYDY
ncbi:DUF3570 domain-containing protein [Moritella sp. 28]|uniref:DUF3570 domain-containing protein n=1 Tax=Moritella sp. 28 TaxID=2746232 RepID=UPI001BA6EB0D|nr:DUF3570 domain-containing protein [Moritella sp. 28]QUM84542.1 DUF3570 domain-containing protein [Moritella sp. 28]